ncbi:hypothetical protein Caci_6408 [Catenulispora acidiphila DSM 44928]|uniref:SGNH hydrolase-type esterase domain-containing protein n=1 Tax=Catenulispora acidiphila (strain DSM 44928 / JCM 14897 / NBRC 102108 / NRRL B-24433 / ID139908) TaxID=479433 RepID=C7PWI2_CATAD|nr:hypothetical protein [Catenulispora acidiphila]ACU75262.1 hypothetical protein Caci_6408 [Catenulispora acidiphila DSM 44928]
MPTGANRRRSIRPLLLAAVLALAWGSAAGPLARPAHAVTAPDSSTDPAAAIDPVSDQDLVADQAMAAASSQAAASGTPQAVTALFSPTEQVFANPGGDYTMTASQLPTQVLKAGSWVPTDATLAPDGSGGLAPKASYDALRLSGGGTTALAALTAQGMTLTMGWPSALPTPAVSGATATYPDVLPGVDLQVSADELGDVSDVLVVKDAAAAADPGLASIAFPVTAPGGTVSADADGNLTVAQADGQARYSAAAPRMWDSATGTDPIVSSPDGPGTAAATAAVGVAVGANGTLTVTPSQSMLTSAATAYPLYVSGPQWHAHWANGPEQAFDEVQQGCPGTSNFDSTTYDGDGLGTGDNTYWDCTGVERAYYRFGLPLSQLAGAQIISATLKTTVSFAASKGSNSDTLNVYSSCGIDGSTTWKHQPCRDTTANPNSPNPLATASFTTTNQHPGLGVGFNVASGLNAALAHHWGTWTLGVTNADESDGSDFVRLAKNPNISIEYDHAPRQPWGLTAIDGSANTACVTTAPYPWMGKTASVTPPKLSAYVGDVDGDQVQAGFHYWIEGTSTGGTVYSTVASGQLAQAPEPQSFVSALATGQTVDWQVRAYDGHAYGPWSPVCHYKIDKTAPDEPGVTSAYYPQLVSGQTPVAAGTPGTFTIQAGVGAATSMTFVYRLDAAPPAVNAPSNEKIAATKVAAGSGFVYSAAITMAAPSPGPHNLYVYSVDQAGNASGEYIYQFLANPDVHVTCADLSSCFNNTLTSTNANPAAGNADGGSASISATDLAAAGWPTAGGTVTVDGAPIKVPAYGNGAKDNALAKGQTIDLPAGTRGSALVILATGTEANAVTPDVDTASVPANVAAPILPGGAPMVARYDATHHVAVYPSGTVAYGTGPTSDYSVSVPDWAAGPAAAAVVTLPHTNTPSGQLARPVKLYAFAIPLSPDRTLSSVSLPDISGAVNENGQLTDTPAIHILGIGVRPVRGAGLPTGAAVGSAWTTAWSSPDEGVYSTAAGHWAAKQTIRTSLTPAVSGSGIRVRLSNEGNTTGLSIAGATLAQQAAAGSPTSSGTPVPLTFGGARAVQIPAGGQVWSDPLPATVTAGQPVLLSESIGATVTSVPGHTWSSGSTTTWLTAADGVDHSGDTAAAAFTATGTKTGHFTNVLAGLDVVTASAVPTVAVLGDNVVNPGGTGMKPVSGSPQLADAMRAAAGGASVVDAGLPDNHVVGDSTAAAGGPALLTRIDRDVLDETGIGTAVLDEGLVDVLGGARSTSTTNAYGVLQNLLTSFGVSAIYATPTPCGGYSACTSTVEAERQNLISYIGNSTYSVVSPYEADFSSAIGGTANPQALLAADDAGDHVNLTPAAYTTLAATVDAAWLKPNSR